MKTVKTKIPGLVKDVSTGAILNLNLSQYEAIKIKRNKAISQQNEIDTLKTELAEIKALLLKQIKETN